MGHPLRTVSDHGTILSRAPVARSLSDQPMVNSYPCAPSLHSVALALLCFAQSLWRSFALLSRLPLNGSNTFLCGASLGLPPYRKMVSYPHANKLLHHIEKWSRTLILTNCSKNVRFSTKPYDLLILEGQRSNIFMFGSLIVGAVYRPKKSSILHPSSWGSTEQ